MWITYNYAFTCVYLSWLARPSHLIGGTLRDGVPLTFKWDGLAGQTSAYLYLDVPNTMLWYVHKYISTYCATFANKSSIEG